MSARWEEEADRRAVERLQRETRRKLARRSDASAVCLALLSWLLTAAAGAYFGYLLCR